MVVTALHRLFQYFFLKIQTFQFRVIHIKMKFVFQILQQETEYLFFLLRYETLVLRNSNLHTMSQVNHLVNKLFYLLSPVVFPAIQITQRFHFLNSTFPVLVPEFLNARGPIGGIL